MERAFIVKEDSDFKQRLNKYHKLRMEQAKFVDQFFNENGIEARSFIMGGNGSFNTPFPEIFKDEIFLKIAATKNDVNKFGKMLNKPDDDGMSAFRKGSPLLKKFADACVEDQVVINIYSPMLRDYFKSIGFNAYSQKAVNRDGKLYIKIASSCLSEDELPDGFEEIKLSEFYLKMEEEKKTS